MKFEIELTKEQEQVFKSIMATRGSRTAQDVMEQIVERGIYALNYRSKRNAKVYAEAKAEREELKELRRELAKARA